MSDRVLNHPAEAITWGLVGLFVQAVRVWASQPADCPHDVDDLAWGRTGDDLWVGHASWPRRLVYPNLSPEVWARLDRGEGQWWMMNDESADATPLAVFQLSLDQRLAPRN